jgi:hypothetical protein
MLSLRAIVGLQVLSNTGTPFTRLGGETSIDHIIMGDDTSYNKNLGNSKIIRLLINRMPEYCQPIIDNGFAEIERVMLGGRPLDAVPELEASA